MNKVNTKIKNIIKEFKEIDENLKNEAEEILLEANYLKFGFGELEVVENPDKNLDKINDLLEKIENKNFQLLIKLNNLLEDNEKDLALVEIEQKMLKIQSKKYLTTKEFEEKYNISISSQRDYRARIDDPLPFIQLKFRGTINYEVEAVEKWLENQYKYN